MKWAISFLSTNGVSRSINKGGGGGCEIGVGWVHCRGGVTIATSFACKKKKALCRLTH